MPIVRIKELRNKYDRQGPWRNYFGSMPAVDIVQPLAERYFWLLFNKMKNSQGFIYLKGSNRTRPWVEYFHSPQVTTLYDFAWQQCRYVCPCTSCGSERLRESIEYDRDVADLDYLDQIYLIVFDTGKVFYTRNRKIRHLASKLVDDINKTEGLESVYMYKYRGKWKWREDYYRRERSRH